MFWDDNFFKEMRRMQQDMEEMHKRMLNLFGEDAKPKFLTQRKKGKEVVFRAPSYNIKETKDKVIAKFELVGVDKKDIFLQVRNNLIEIKVEKKSEAKVKKKDSYHYEASMQQFYRVIPIYQEVDGEKAKANYKNGILTVEIPKIKKDKGYVNIK